MPKLKVRENYNPVKFKKRKGIVMKGQVINDESNEQFPYLSINIGAIHE
jgi:hypothetical protein